MTVEELQKASKALAMSIRDQIQQFEERADGVYVEQIILSTETRWVSGNAR